MPDDITIRAVRGSDRDRAVEMLVASFAEDPALSWPLRKGTEGPRARRLLFATRKFNCPKQGPIVTTTRYDPW